MKKYFMMFGAAGLLAGMLMIGGCGDDNNKYDKKTTDVPATVSGQTATVTAATAVVTKDGQTVTTIPAGATLTATAGAMPSSLSIVVKTPDNGKTSGVPSKSGFELDDAAGAVDLSIPGVTAFTVGAPGATIAIPVVNATGLAEGTPVPVTQIKADGTSSELTGAYSAASKTVTVTGVTNFCWFIANPTWVQSGSTTTAGVTTTTAGVTTTTAGVTTTTGPVTTTTAGPVTTTTAGPVTTTTTTLPSQSVTITGQATDDATTGNKTYTLAALSSTYTYTINGFAAGDKIAGPAGVTPTMPNSSFTDGNVDLQYASNGNVVIIRLTGLTTAQDGQLWDPSRMNVVFGAGTLN